jgi:predicted MFS family arabinose efflux permease
VAVNASTLGMAVASLLVGLFSTRINRRLGILLSLTLLAIPTTLLATAPDLMVFSVLRVTQGLCMASAFTLMLAYLGEQCSATDTAGAFAAYVTGNVASNLVGRLISAGVTDHFGLATNFYLLACLNLCGAALVYFTIDGTPRMHAMGPGMGSPMAAWLTHFRNRRLLAAFAIGFCILFAFIGTFSYVNFVLVRPPLQLAMMQVGFVYFVFLPAIFTTPLAGGFVRRHGARASVWASLGLAIAGLPLLLLPHLVFVLAGMVVIAAGTFFAQAVATGFVGQAATSDRGTASGLYLAAYFAGGLAGSVVLGQLFDGFGWAACVAGIAAALGLACLLAFGLTPPPNRDAVASAQQ